MDTLDALIVQAELSHETLQEILDRLTDRAAMMALSPVIYDVWCPARVIPLLLSLQSRYERRIRLNYRSYPEPVQESQVWTDGGRFHWIIEEQRKWFTATAISNTILFIPVEVMGIQVMDYQTMRLSMPCLAAKLIFSESEEL